MGGHPVLSSPFFIQDPLSLMARVEAYELQRQAHLEHIRAQIQDTELEECSFAPRMRKTRKAPQVWPECLPLAHIQLAELQYTFSF